MIITLLPQWNFEMNSNKRTASKGWRDGSLAVFDGCLDGHKIPAYKTRHRQANS
jgi:hypothetical protein